MIKINKKIVIISTAAILLIALAAILLNSFKQAYLSILVAPTDSTIYINGKKFKNGIYRLFPGEVTVRIEHDSMKTKALKLTLENGKTETLQKYLLSDSEDGFAAYRAGKEDYEILKLVAKDDDGLKFVEQYEKSKMILDILPLERQIEGSKPSSVNGSYWHETVIRSGLSERECKQAVCLLVYTNTGNLDMAEQMLSERGYDINNYQIIEYSK